MFPTIHAAIATLLLAGAAGAADPLAEAFRSPPDASKPWAYWWWLDGNASREGITRDLEEMRRQGIAGVLVFDAGEGGPDAPKGPAFLSAPWRELFRHAVAEAGRLGIEMGVNLSSGWNAGGPWVRPDDACRRLVHGSLRVDGPRRFSGELPPLPAGDAPAEVAVVAYREVRSAPAVPARISASSSYSGYPPANAADGEVSTRWISDGDKPGRGPTAEAPAWLLLEYPGPLAATALRVVPHEDCGPRECELQAPADGGDFRTVARFSMESRATAVVTFPETEARAFRLLIRSSFTFGKAEGTWNAQVAEIALFRPGEDPGRPGGLRNWELKSGNRGVAPPMGAGLPEFDDELPDASGDRNAEAGGVLDLSARVRPGGILDWEVPEGSWRILRFASVVLPQKTRCASPGNQGLEIDVLSADAMDRHFAETAAKLIADAGPLAGKTLRYLHIDSYEIGADLGGQQPTWSGRYRDEFRARRGYDPLPWLPVLAGKVVGGRELSNRFLRDHRLTIADLIAVHYYGRLRELAARHGLGTHSESGYGSYPLPHIDGLRCAGANDIPMGEFWKRQSEPSGPIVLSEFAPFCDVIRTIASAAHAYGRPICQAEAFTSMGPNWEEDFHDLKDVGDRAFCSGLTRNVLCFYVHQPRLDIVPGYQWEAAGTHFDRNVTWWNRIDAWTAYLSRCQHLLRQGVPAADICYYVGEDVPVFVPARQYLRPAMPEGYDFDAVNAEVLLGRMSVRDGRLVLPEGTAYRLLVLPRRRTMSPEVLRKLRDLVEGGATIVGPKPLRAPGLAGYPKCDEEVREIAEALWGPGEGPGAGGRRAGKGRVFHSEDLASILAKDGIPEDLSVDAGGIEWIHRTSSEAEIWFLANTGDRPVDATARFRVAGRQPEIGDPVTGALRDSTGWWAEGANTGVRIRFAPRQSFFVLFRRPGSPPAAPSTDFPAFWRLTELRGPWEVRFDPARGGPASASFERLEDWTKRPEEGIRNYSGTAAYRLRFDIPGDVFRLSKVQGRGLAIDLGKVENVARVRLNGTDLGTVWTDPWRVEIDGVARQEGNDLEIEVTNLWPNRLIGDAALPPEKRITTTNVKKFKADSPLLPSGLLGPVTLGIIAKEKP